VCEDSEKRKIRGEARRGTRERRESESGGENARRIGMTGFENDGSREV